MSSEAALRKSVLDAMLMAGRWAWVNTVPTPRFRQGPGQNQIGSPDILAIHRGRLIGIETKLPGNVLTPDQVEWHALARQAGASIYVVRSLEEAIEILRSE